MSNNDEENRSEDDEDDDDYSPTKNKAEGGGGGGSTSSSSSSSEAEEDTEEKPDDSKEIKPYDQSKVDELWKNFTDKPKEETKPIVEKSSTAVPSTTTTTVKRPAPATSVLDRLGIGKKQKLSTLEKSRLDWQAHKESEALTDDLESHRRGKNSYVEKQAFLQRTETREHDHFLNQIKKK